MANTDRSFRYSAKDVSVNITKADSGVALRVTGWAKDSFLDITYNSPAQDLEIGADGTGVRSQSSDQSAKITLRLLQNSLAHKELQKMLAADLASNDGDRKSVV